MPGGGVALVCAAVLAGQASIGWSNDWLDADRDRAVARADKPVVQGTVGPAALRSAASERPRWPSSSRSCSASSRGCCCSSSSRAAGRTTPGLKRTAASVVPYVTGFGALPAGVVAAAPGTPVAPWWLVTAGGALGAAAHLANVAPDLEDDLATGIRGLPHRLGAAGHGCRPPPCFSGAASWYGLGPAGPPTPAGWVGLALRFPPSSWPPWPERRGCGGWPSPPSCC